MYIILKCESPFEEKEYLSKGMGYLHGQGGCEISNRIQSEGKEFHLTKHWQYCFLGERNQILSLLSGKILMYGVLCYYGDNLCQTNRSTQN